MEVAVVPQHVRVRDVEVGQLEVESLRVAYDAQVHARKLELVTFDDVRHRGDGSVERFAESFGEAVDERPAAADMTVRVSLLRSVYRRAAQETSPSHVVGGHDAFDCDAEPRYVLLKRAYAVEKARVLDDEAPSILLDHEHLVVDRVARAVRVQLHVSEIVHVHQPGL